MIKITEDHGNVGGTANYTAEEAEQKIAELLKQNPIRIDFTFNVVQANERIDGNPVKED